MAIDTREKRQAASMIHAYFSPSPTPNAALDVEWRQEVGWGYPGIAPSSPAVGRLRMLMGVGISLALVLMG